MSYTGSLYSRVCHSVSSHNTFLLGSSAVEQVTVNHLVAGSIPARAAIIKVLKLNALGLFCIYVLRLYSQEAYHLGHQLEGPIFAHSLCLFSYNIIRSYRS